MSFHVGETFGDYQITGIIGAGSMGQVFQAEHCITKRKEAVKVVAAEYAAEKQIKRFQREIAVQAALSHPNIAAVHNALHIEGRFVLIMEFIEGQTLEHLLQSGSLPLDTGVGYIRQTLEALHYAHDRGVIHRDVTPANLIVTSAGTVKLTDFGVARAFGDIQLTNYGEVVGSLQYMAPEQIGGGSPPDPRSDLYSVGAVLYEIVTGRKPFEESKLPQRLIQQEPEVIRPTEVNGTLPPQWDAIIGRALVADPAERYQSAKEFLAALPGGAPAAVPAGAAKHRALLKAIVAASAGAVVLFAAGGLSVSRFRIPPPPPAVTFPIASPNLAPPAPAVNARKVDGRRKIAKRQTARRIHREKDVRAANATQNPNPQPPPLAPQVQSARPDAPSTRGTPAEVVPPQDTASKATPAESIPPSPTPRATPAAVAPQIQATPPTAVESVPPGGAPPKKRNFWGKFKAFRKKSESSQSSN